MRCSEMAYGVPSAWAKRLTRNSSIIQRIWSSSAVAGSSRRSCAYSSWTRSIRRVCSRSRPGFWVSRYSRRSIAVR
jgi:hypothetical protein